MKAWMVYTEGAKAILEDGLEHVKVSAELFSTIGNAYRYAGLLEDRLYVAYVKEVEL